MSTEHPDGLRVEPADPNPIGIAYRAHCEAHAHCRARGMVWTAASWEDLHLRVHLAFLAHCQDMDQLT